MLETLIELYTDAFYDAKEEYVEKLEEIRKEGIFESFTDITDLKRLIEEDFRELGAFN